MNSYYGLLEEMENLLDFSGQVVLVTGASRGIGKATAEIFAVHGAKVAVHYHKNSEAAQQVLKALEGDGHVMFQADVADPDAVQSLIEQIINTMGRIDVLVNNAGIDHKLPFEKVDYHEWQAVWRETVDINLLGPANVTFCTVQQMIKQGGGRIISLSSRGAFRGMPGSPAYGATKAGINALTQSLARELGQHNIFFYSVAPGIVQTDMAAAAIEGLPGEMFRKETPLGRVGQPEEVARTILFLASKKTEFLTGAIIDINGASYCRS